MCFVFKSHELKIRQLHKDHAITTHYNHEEIRWCVATFVSHVAWEGALALQITAFSAFTGSAFFTFQIMNHMIRFAFCITAEVHEWELCLLDHMTRIMQSWLNITAKGS